jgi:isopentenyldiphosphate isomerase
MADTELIDIVDENNDITGTADVKTAHEERLLHRVVGIFLFDLDGNLILQSGNKFNKLDISVGGHVKKGESYDEAAIREMSEELNLSASLKHISTFKPLNAKFNHYWSIYKAHTPEGWQFTETDEVKSVMTISIEEVKEKIKNDSDSFTHGFINAFTEFLKHE